MTLWTIQPIEVWQNLQTEGVLRTQREHVVAHWWGQDNLFSYNWLRKQMIERIGPPPEADVYPVWAYFQFADKKHRRPDLRHVRPWYPREQNMALLEISIDESRTLLSDYHDWHYVLNDWYFPLSLDDFELFTNANHDEETARQLKLASWPHTFDLDFHAPEVTSPRDEKTIQATFWELRLEDVVGVRQFTGSGNLKNFALDEGSRERALPVACP